MKKASKLRVLRKTFQSLFLIFGCIHLTGGPYALVQAYAWANMIVTYSREGSIGNAVADTFSGEKPCALCKKITAAKASEPKERGGEENLATIAAKPSQDLFPPSRVSLNDPFSSPLSCPAFSLPGEPASLPASGPPVPPPRC